MKNHSGLLFAFSVLLTGCNHYYYVSSTQNVPLFKERNEYHLAGSLSKGDESESAEIQTAYSITNHLGIMANYMKTKIGDFEKKDYVNGKNFDLGLGYFQPLGEDGIFEIYSGYGRNRQHHGYSTTDYVSDGDSYLKYSRYYIQPSFGFAFDHFDVAASVRVSQLWYTFVDYDLVGHDEDLEILRMLPRKTHYMLEPAITLRSGWRYIKFQFQASYAEYLNDLDEEDDFYDFVEEPHVSFGIYLTLANRWKMSKSSEPDTH